MLYQENLISSNHKRELMECEKNTYILGTLAVDELYYPRGETQEAVTTLNGGSGRIIFYLKALSQEPKPIYSLYIGKTPLYIGKENDQPTSIINDPVYRWKSESEKIKYWREKLEGKLIVFKPIIDITKTGQIHLNLEIQSIEGDYDKECVDYITIPEIKMDIKVFEEKLLSESFLTLPNYSHFMDDPEYIICGDYLYFNFEHWSKSSNNKNMWKVDRGVNEILKIRLDDENIDFYSLVAGGADGLVFIDNRTKLEINDYIHDFGTLVSKCVEMEEYLINDQQKLENLSKKINDNFACSQEIGTKQYRDNSIRENLNEDEFLESLYTLTVNEKLHYDIYDLINFHVSIKTNPLTVVAGMSGTGKTQLARIYAKTLGLSEEDENLLFLPITPAYLEPADVLGYLNPTTGLYVPSDTGLIEILIKAEENPERLHMIIFDEMNLSQVEHWFAPFLSLLELRPEYRRLKLYGKNSICHNAFKYRDSILIGENVIFVGTVNLDETTKDFSDRLLDRVNLVTLHKASFSQLKALSKNDDNEVRVNNFSYAEFKSWINQDPGIDAFNEQEILLFDTVHEVINKYDSQKGVSYRMIEKIGRYINNIPVLSDEKFNMSKEIALDLGIKQRLLTKLKGSERQFGSLIGTMSTIDEVEQKGELLLIFEGEEVQKISQFTETIKEIKRKALELGIYGYTS